jgi:hypothetical protein
MLGDFDVPKGTSPQDFLLAVLPKWHARAVPKSESGAFLLLVELVGDGAYTLQVRGPELEVQAIGKAEPSTQPSARIQMQERDVRFFLGDWSHAGLFRPRFAPRLGATVPTDPRLLKRLLLVSGTFKLGLRDVATDDGIRTVDIVAVLGARASAAGSATARPDLSISTTAAFYLQLLGGKFAPEDALGHPEVTVIGKRMLAMQAAFALAPWLPSPTSQRT